ncbi:MAG: hypothetical protein L0228_00670 [Planctomycetes bacterium]|nr:hypothetical protein [Planctomycetota bacterium]
MALSLKQFLVLILFAGFALAALMNSERTFMIEMVKVVTFATLVLMAYGTWANVGERRAYCAGFVLWGGIYYTLFVVLRSHRIDIGTDTFLLWLGPKLDSGRIMWAVFEKTGHLLLSLVFGILGAWVTVYFYRKRHRLLDQRSSM